ncbi:MAG TPA: Na+/H+ antiporter subunit E [Egibacteraceae bacterium]|nr:Na+/H+ antiporter subunit E [Egibacteraceae bacterium]
MLPAMVAWVPRWLGLWALWIAVTGSLAGPDVVTGAVVAAAVAVLSTWAVNHIAPPGLQRRWLHHLPTVAWTCVTDTVVLTRVLVSRLCGRPVSGRFVELSFEHGDAPSDAARRAFVTVTTSAMPNTYVVGFDRRRGTIVVHELHATDDPPIAEELTTS